MSWEQQDQPQSYQSYAHYSAPHPPPVSPPWYAEWLPNERQFLFVNQQTGERTWIYPGPGYAQHQGNYGAPQPDGGYGYGQYGYSNQGAYQQSAYDPTRSSEPAEQKSGGNGWKYAAVGAAGLAGGALLMHESDKIEDGFDTAKDALESNMTSLGTNLSNFPENAAAWTGEQVGHVENFGDDVQQTWDEGVDRIENFPGNAAEWSGEKVQAVEDFSQDVGDSWDGQVQGMEEFGDRMGDAFDEGREQERYDDSD
ncbi:hypothetical protein BDW02DRAFT_570646 [Decorospora gaudefroyi]|uniref:WW domain-containing protein n=1 Tax=Decorospora gaudefroyi TaxID=184978 RepID=A0A6A5K8U8_9PLEO|nr:hypothetical protein BDW02DRAFT_570646 [Decorospora gaudefroyi]